MPEITIRPMIKSDISSVARVHSESFIRQFASNKWITCNFNAYPRILMYVATRNENEVVGYIQWVQKSGFRKEAVIELEQIAVLPEHQNKKIGKQLILLSLQSVKEYLQNQNARLKTVLVSTRFDNLARNLYEKTLGVEVCATIKSLYSADEVLLSKIYE